MVGLVALGMLVIAQLIGAWGLRGPSLRDYVASFRSFPDAITIASFLLFAAMPLLLPDHHGDTPRTPHPDRS